jgi:small subunit ribosomal protein S2
MMPSVGLKDLLEAGVHFGHQTRKWNPKMKPYIFIARGGIYIIDLQKTLRAINRACEFLTKVAARGGTVLFVGTKKQAKVAIRDYAQKAGMPYVTERWLGGMLTNFQTIYKSVQKLEDIEAMMADGRMAQFSKKEQLEFSRTYEKLNKNLGGIRRMKGLPEAVFVVDTAEEETAVREANKLSIPVIGIVDTNADPTLIDYPIPGNDDAIRAINLFARAVADAIEEGRHSRAEGRDDASRTEEGRAKGRDRESPKGESSNGDAARGGATPNAEVGMAEESPRATRPTAALTESDSDVGAAARAADRAAEGGTTSGDGAASALENRASDRS